MNVQRFTGKNAREAIARVRASLGEHAVVLSNRPIADGVEILAIPGSDIPQATEEPGRPPAVRQAARSRVEPMSTVSFENYVRERQRQTPSQEEAPARPSVQAAVRAPHVPDQPGRFAAQVLAAICPPLLLPPPPPP